MKTILITGGAGFIGHHIISKLLKETELNVVTLDRLDFSGNLNRLQEIVSDEYKHRFKYVFHDLKSEINPLLAKQIGKVEYIAHVAAGSHVNRSIEDPLSFVYDNVVGTCNILNFARSLDSLDKFIYFSTDEVFGSAPEGISYVEEARYNSTNPYSASKAGGEELTVAFNNTYNLPACISHTMNVFGERQHPEKFIPYVMNCVLKGKTVNIHSNPTLDKAGSRFYIHAEDVADAVIHMLTCDLSSIPVVDRIKCHKFNIVGSTELDNLELAQYIASVLNKPLKYKMVDYHTDRPGHDIRYALNGEKTQRILGWQPHSVYDRLEQVIKWTLTNDRWLHV